MATSDSNLNNSDLPFNVWIFGFQWVLVNSIGNFLLGYLFLHMLPQSSLSLFSSYQEAWGLGFFLNLLLSGILTGLVLGGGQWFLLQRHFVWPVSWIWISILGWFAVGIWATIMPFPTLNTAIFVVPIGALISGIILGAVQWLILRQQVYYASWWIIANGLSWLTRTFISLALYLSGFDRTSPLYGLLDTIVEIFKQGLQETIIVLCLIWLLKITLRKDAEIEEE